MKNKILRVVVSILLVCILIFNITLIRAEASALPEAATVVTKVIPFAKVVEPAALGLGGTVFCWVAAALGIAFTAKEAVDAYNAYQDFTGDLETAIYYYPDGSWSYGVDVGFVDRVRAFLFDKGYVVDASKMVTTVPEGVAFGGFMPRVPCVAYQYSYHNVVDDEYKVYNCAYLLSTIPNDPYVTSVTSACSTSIKVNEKKHYFKTIASGVKTYSQAEFEEFLVTASDYYHLGEMSSVDAALKNVFKIYGWTGIRGAGNVAIDYVAPLTVPMIEAYPEWYTNSQPATNPDTYEETTVLPIPLNPSADPETQIGTLTQPDIWQGAIAEPLPEFGDGSDLTVSSTPWEQFKKWISAGWDKIINAIPSAESIAQSIGNVIRELFVPSPDTIAQKVGEMRDQFPFIDGIISTGVSIRDGLSYDIAPPEIWIDLGEATTDTFGHKKYLITDFSWYAPYKPRVDALLSAALWAFFSWRVFVRLPSIIGGEGGQIESYASHMHALDMKNAESEEKKRRGKK